METSSVLFVSIAQASPLMKSYSKPEENFKWWNTTRHNGKTPTAHEVGLLASRRIFAYPVFQTRSCFANMCMNIMKDPNHKTGATTVYDKN